jgi:hypothetical protein
LWLAAAAVAVLGITSSAPGAQGQPAEYQYVIPPGWLPTRYPDGIVVRSPLYDNGELCQISIFPIRPANGRLEDQIRPLFAQYHGVDPFQGPVSPLLPIVLVRGTSPFGWPYLLLRRSVGGQAGDYGSLVSRRLLLVGLGDQMAVIATTSKDPQVSRCFGTLAGDLWPSFFATLRFANWRALLPPDLSVLLSGIWTTATASVADRYVMAPNGRYASAAAVTNRRTTDAFFGDGRYSVTDNVLVFVPDDRSPPISRWFRVEQRSEDGGRTWLDQLCLLEPGQGDVCYERER